MMLLMLPKGLNKEPAALLWQKKKKSRLLSVQFIFYWVPQYFTFHWKQKISLNLLGIWLWGRIGHVHKMYTNGLSTNDQCLSMLMNVLSNPGHANSKCCIVG